MHIPRPSLALLRAVHDGADRGTGPTGLPHRATVRRSVRTPGAGGVATVTTADVLVAEPCRVGQERIGAEAQAADQTVLAIVWTVAFRAGTDVREGDRLLVSGTSGGRAFTRTLDVDGVNDADAHQVRLLAVCNLPAPLARSA